MKLIVGEDKFDGLPAFSRWLALANDIVKNNEKKRETAAKQTNEGTNKNSSLSEYNYTSKQVKYIYMKLPFGWYFGRRKRKA